jgi:hypothetical protein
MTMADESAFAVRRYGETDFAVDPSSQQEWPAREELA